MRTKTSFRRARIFRSIKAIALHSRRRTCADLRRILMVLQIESERIFTNHFSRCQFVVVSNELQHESMLAAEYRSENERTLLKWWKMDLSEWFRIVRCQVNFIWIFNGRGEKHTSRQTKTKLMRALVCWAGVILEIAEIIRFNCCVPSQSIRPLFTRQNTEINYGCY